jgi:hypothetical protein
MSLVWTPFSSPVAGDIPTGATRSQRPGAEMPPTVALFEQLAARVRAEYREMPGLNLTREQARCLWAIDGPLCDRLLAHLVDTGFLARTPRATYVRHTGG